MKTIQLTFLFEDTGFCKDVFQSVNQPYYYCNRDTVDGTWYTSTPDDYQNDCRIRKDVIIEIISDGQVIALDGNGDFEGKNHSSLSVPLGNDWLKSSWISTRDYTAMKI